MQTLWIQGQSLAHFTRADSSFSHSGLHQLFFFTLEKNGGPGLEESGDGASWVYSASTLQTPTLSPSSGQFRKNFFFWASPIEPCQEKIISRQGSELFAGEQKKWGRGKWAMAEPRAERASVNGKVSPFLGLNHSQRMPVVSAWPVRVGGCWGENGSFLRPP